MRRIKVLLAWTDCIICIARLNAIESPGTCARSAKRAKSLPRSILKLLSMPAQSLGCGEYLVQKPARGYPRPGARSTVQPVHCSARVYIICSQSALTEVARTYLSRMVLVSAQAQRSAPGLLLHIYVLPNHFLDKSRARALWPYSVQDTNYYYVKSTTNFQS